jgi:hypothetical protein
MKTILGIAWGALVASALVIGCAPPDTLETRGATTSRLLRPHAAASLPASPTGAFTAALGGAPIEIDGWEGYVAGTAADALFLVHLSGVQNGKGVAGLSVALFAGPGATSDEQLLASPRLEVRFNDSSGLVSTHTFGAAGTVGTTNAAHSTRPASRALLERAFSDAETLLRVPVDSTGGGERAQRCLASFLSTISGAARCVDNAANTSDCAVVRAEAVATAANCAGSKTANVLESAGSVGTKTFGGGIFGGGGGFCSLGGSPLSSFASVLLGGMGGMGGMGGGFGGGYNGGLGGYGGQLGGMPFCGDYFGGGSLPRIGGMATASFGNQWLGVDPRFGGVSGEGIFDCGSGCGGFGF